MTADLTKKHPQDLAIDIDTVKTFDSRLRIEDTQSNLILSIKVLVTLLISLCLATITAFLLTCHISYDYGDVDVQIYSTIAHFWEKGLIPYRDLYDFKPPMIYLIYRVAYSWWSLSGESVWKMLLLLTSFTSFIILYSGVLFGQSLRAVLLTFLVYWVIVADPMSYSATFFNTEIWAVLFTLCSYSFIAFVVPYRPRAGCLFSGFFLGAAIMSKQPAALFFFPMLIPLIYGAKNHIDKFSMLWLFKLLLYFSVGVITLVGAWAIYFWLNDSLFFFYQAVFLDGSKYTRLLDVENLGQLWDRISFSSPFNLILIRSFGRMFITILAFSIILLWYFRIHQWLEICLWVAVGLVAFNLSPSRFPSYSLFLLPALLISTTYFSIFLLDPFNNPRRNNKDYLDLLRMLPAFCILIITTFWDVLYVSSAKTGVLPYNLQEMLNSTAIIKPYVNDKKCQLFLFGLQPIIYAYTDLCPASPFFYPGMPPRASEVLASLEKIFSTGETVLLVSNDATLVRFHPYSNEITSTFINDNFKAVDQNKILTAYVHKNRDPRYPDSSP